jgi:hypothetical protein
MAERGYELVSAAEAEVAKARRRSVRERIGVKLGQHTSADVPNKEADVFGIVPLFGPAVPIKKAAHLGGLLKNWMSA